MANFNVVEFITDDIIIEGDDLVVDGKVLPIKQKLVFAGLNYRRDISHLTGGGNAFPPSFGPVTVGGGNSVTITIYSLLYHRNEDGGFGERVRGGYIKEYETPLIANQTTWIDTTTGMIIGNVGEELNPDNIKRPVYDEAGTLIEPAGKFFGKTIMKEGQMYDKIAQLDKVTICDLIRQSMQLNKHRCQPKQNMF